MTGTDDYLETRVMTASPVQLHLMVVEGTLRHCLAAKVSIENDDREKTWSALCEARSHIVELISGVAEGDDEILVQIRGLFQFAYRELMLADSEQNTDRIDSAIRVLELHRETWMMFLDQQETPSEATPSTGLRLGA